MVDSKVRVHDLRLLFYIYKVSTTNFRALGAYVLLGLSKPPYSVVDQLSKRKTLSRVISRPN